MQWLIVYLLKRNLKSDIHFNPRPWTRLESIIILLILSAIAALGQQSPLHETTVTSGLVSNLFISFYQGQFQPKMTVQFVLNPTSISFIVLALLFFALMILSLSKEHLQSCHS